MKHKILNSILKKINDPDLINLLVEGLSLSELQSLLLEVYQRRIEKFGVARVFEQYQQNRFVLPATVSATRMLEFDRIAYSLLPDAFEILELSPVSPLGSCSAMAPVSQFNVVSTIRNTEVLSDPTNTLALEIAKRRRSGIRGAIKLACSQRVLRAQKFDEPAAFPHFRLFALCSGGRDSGNYNFELHTLKEHLAFYLHLFTDLAGTGIVVNTVRVVILAFNDILYGLFKDMINDELLNKNSLADIVVKNSSEANGSYYRDCRMQIYCGDTGNTEHLIVDGGFTGWTAKILSNNKERLFTSGLGSERLIHCFAE